MPYSRNPTAIMNEQTAAYAVIPVIAEMLLTTYLRVIPMTFWSTREGTAKAIAGFVNHSMKVIAVYPRRPKTLEVLPGDIFIRLNQQLYDHAVELNKNDIPVFAVAPMVELLPDLYEKPACCYFYIDPSGYEQIVKVDTRAPSMQTPALSEPEVLALIESKAKVTDYFNVVTNIRSSSRRGEHFYLFNRWAQYKPIYFLCLTSLA